MNSTRPAFEGSQSRTDRPSAVFVGFLKKGDIVPEDGLSLIKSPSICSRLVPECQNISVSIHCCKKDVAIEE